jgi:hypothetical protein
MKSVEHLISATLKKSGDFAASLHKQAPGARMIGEFAVKQAGKELEKIASRIRVIHSSLRPK